MTPVELTKDERHHLRYLLGQEIKKKQRALDKFAPKPGQAPEEAAKVRQNFVDKIEFMKAIVVKLYPGRGE